MFLLSVLSLLVLMIQHIFFIEQLQVNRIVEHRYILVLCSISSCTDGLPFPEDWMLESKILGNFRKNRGKIEKKMEKRRKMKKKWVKV